MPKPEEKKHCLGLDLFMTDAKQASSELHWVVRDMRPGWKGDARLALGCQPIRDQLEKGVYDAIWRSIWVVALNHMGLSCSWVPITEGGYKGLYHMKIKETI